MTEFTQIMLSGMLRLNHTTISKLVHWQSLSRMSNDLSVPKPSLRSASMSELIPHPKGLRRSFNYEPLNVRKHVCFVWVILCQDPNQWSKQVELQKMQRSTCSSKKWHDWTCDSWLLNSCSICFTSGPRIQRTIAIISVFATQSVWPSESVLTCLHSCYLIPFWSPHILFTPLLYLCIRGNL